MEEKNVKETTEPLDSDPVAAKLKNLGLAEDVISKIKSELGAESESDLTGLTEEDLVGVGMKKLQARKLVAALKPPPTVASPESISSGPVAAVSFDEVLPAVPTDASWVEALRTGGVLKVDQSTVIR